ncbi:MAG: SDR family oxidoreductase [Nitrosopumilales archaeon]|nr:MAG: SDR family oxidoreductase [Nitrosopumilales archaeon]
MDIRCINIRSMKTIAVFGGTGGIGSKLIPLLEKKYNVISIGSKDVDITYFYEVHNFFNVNDVDIVLNLSGKKYDVFLNKITAEDYQPIVNMLDVNIMGNINILAACLPKMVEKKYGRIIAISSVFAEMNVPKNTIYSASKAFVDRFMSAANRENIKYGITCNSIQLGYWEEGMGQRIDDKYKKAALDKIGLKRWGKIEELYNTIDYLIENEYICGTNLKIDGGL